MIVNKYPEIFNPHPQSIQVQVKKVDELFPETHFDVIKADIEGSELKFLKGAEKLLTNKRPRVLFVEIHDELFEETDKEARKYFRFVRRVAVENSSRSLILQPSYLIPDKDVLSKYSLRPPFYVYTNDESIFCI